MGRSEFKELSLNQIQSIDDAKTPLVGTAQLRIKGLTEVFILDLNYGQAKHLSEVKEIIASATSKSQSIQISSASQDIPEQLAKYKELLDKGVITQNEFDAKKKQLLGL
ncbi:MAG: SHOCT domain-containing protein [Clostridia bacterium]|nr:SHOCT domain-containing protein [Clostridia bacterium]